MQVWKEQEWRVIEANGRITEEYMAIEPQVRGHDL